MIAKGIIIEDFVNYKVPCLTLQTPYCTFKCDKECGKQVCQNSTLATAPISHFSDDVLIKKYIENNITKAICFQGLEPFDNFEDVYDFIFKLRKDYNNFDPVVIYTGYNKEEISSQLKQLTHFENIIVKYGRFIPDQQSHFDSVLGVNLASDNQYAERIS